MFSLQSSEEDDVSSEGLIPPPTIASSIWEDEEDDAVASVTYDHTNLEAESIGSAGSLVMSSGHSAITDLPTKPDLDLGRLSPGLPNKNDYAGVGVFLATLGLAEWIPLFERERIDIYALNLINDDDLRTMGVPTGPRKKIIKALTDRKRDLQEEVAMHDSKL